MSENYRKPIGSLNKLPQFTTMNVIDGQAGVVNYSSLIFYSLTIDNILNIIILLSLILAGVSIATLTGNNGILFQATNAKEQTRAGKIEEIVELWKIESEIPNGLTASSKTEEEPWYEVDKMTPWYGDNENIKKVDFLNKIVPTDTSYWFWRCWNLTTVEHIINLDTSKVENMFGMFFECCDLTSLDVSNFNTANVVDMGAMFVECNSITALDVSNFDTSQVITMDRMFENVTAPVKIGEKWNKTTMTEEATGYSGSFSI